MNNRSVCVCALAGVLACVAAPMAATRFGQSSTTGPDLSAFVYDVVSIKPYKQDPNATSSFMGAKETPDGYSGTNTPLSVLIFAAYRTEHTQISGQPAWLNNDRYDVEAKMDPDVAEALHKLNADDQKLARKHMMQVLVQDRMKVVVHMDTKEISVYELVIARNGIRMKEATDPNAPQGGLRVSGAGGGAYQWQGQNEPISGMIGQLSYAAGRPVYDKTGLTGRFEFTLKYTPERQLTAAASDTASAPVLETAPPLMQALEEQLGLKLVSGKGMMDVIVIDQVERPSPN